MKPQRVALVIGAVGIAALATQQILARRDALRPEHPLPPAPHEMVAYPPRLPDTAPSETKRSKRGGMALCGYGAVDPERVPAQLQAEADAGIVRALDRLEAGRDEDKRATALAMRALLEAQLAQEKVIVDDPATCLGSELCFDREAAAFVQAATPRIAALVRLAVATRDPQTVTAMRACRSVLLDQAPPESCSALSYAQWAALEPDNAMPWLMLAREARQRKDPAGLDEAFLRASQAKMFDRHATRYGDILASASLGGEPVDTLAVARVANAEMRDDPGEYFARFTMFHLYCARSDEPGRRERCGHLARMLIDHSEDHLGLQIASLIGADGGWSQLEQDALRRRFPPRAFFEGPRYLEDFGCERIADAERRLRGVAQYGEAGYWAREQQADSARK
jgi:hypothetical protein